MKHHEKATDTFCTNPILFTTSNRQQQEQFKWIKEELRHSPFFLSS